MKAQREIWLLPQWPVVDDLPSARLKGVSFRRQWATIGILLGVGAVLFALGFVLDNVVLCQALLAHAAACALALVGVPRGASLPSPPARPRLRLAPAIQVRPDTVAVSDGWTTREIPRVGESDVRIDDGCLFSGEMRVSLAGADLDDLADALRETAAATREEPLDVEDDGPAEGWQQPPTSVGRNSLAQYRNAWRHDLPTAFLRVPDPAGLPKPLGARIQENLRHRHWALWWVAAAISFYVCAVIASSPGGDSGPKGNVVLAVGFFSGLAAAWLLGKMVAFPAARADMTWNLAGADVFVSGDEIVVEKHDRTGRLEAKRALRDKDKRVRLDRQRQQLCTVRENIDVPGLDAVTFREMAESHGWTVD